MLRKSRLGQMHERHATTTEDVKMQIRHVTISNFRGIDHMSWTVQSPLTCVIGIGDVGKSTILDAIEAALSSKWTTFSDFDFRNGDTSKPIEIEVTVGELSPELLRESRFGLHLRGWTATGTLRDEPEGSDEAVVSVRVRVDETLEPSWELVTDRAEPTAITPRDRTNFGVVRLGGDSDRHLTWGHGSALSRLQAKDENAAILLAEAYRKARDLLGEGMLPGLEEVGAKVRDQAMAVGAYAREPYRPGLDAQRSSMSLSGLSLHSNGIPLRMFGQGTRRLVTFALQRLAIPAGAIVLIDELEHGLEPHRIRHLLKVLRRDYSSEVEKPKRGQVILTTHSAVTIVELACTQLAVAHNDNGTLELRTPPALLQPLVRRVPEGLLNPKVIVCEGKTEVGLIRGLRESWAARHDSTPPETKGVGFVDGNGAQAPATALELRRLGYHVCILRDSDVPLTSQEAAELSAAGIDTFEWEGKLATEERILADLSASSVQSVLEIAYELHSQPTVLQNVREQLGLAAPPGADFANWHSTGKSDEAIRRAIGTLAKKRSWFKQIEPGQRLGEIVALEFAANASATPTATLLAKLEAWVYA